MVKNITEHEFEDQVLKASHEIAVLVDFWAEWCGPCRVLGPILEKIAEEYSSQLQLVKVNTEQNQQIAQKYQIQSIPAVKLFINGLVVGEFVGALPEPSIKAFLAQHLPNPYLDKALEEVTAGEGIKALELIRQAGASLKADEVLWQWCEAFAGDKQVNDTLFSEALQMISPYGSPFSDRRNALLEQVKQNETQKAREVLSSQGDVHIEALLGSLEKTQDNEAKNTIRAELVQIFTILGQQTPKIAEYRRRMSKLLY